MAIEIVDFPIEDGDFPVRYVSHYRRLHPSTGHLEIPASSESSAALLGRLSDVFHLNASATNHQELHGGSSRAASGANPAE